MAQLRKVKVRKVRGEGSVEAEDQVTEESPLEVELCSTSCRTFAFIMRTPGEDSDLALGFLFYEGVIRRVEDVREVREYGGRVQVELRREVEVEPRSSVVNSSCGLCGSLILTYPKASVEGYTGPVDPEVVIKLPETLRGKQRLFNSSGGAHAAGLFDELGNLMEFAEDVGRHNAVDKVVGKLLRSGRIPLGKGILQVSGRVSFEIVAKAAKAGIPVVSAVSAPTGLAVEAGEDLGVTVIGFVRNNGFNVYSRFHRIGRIRREGD